MKVKIYLRVAKSSGSKGYRVAAATRPSDQPIYSDNYGHKTPLPTVSFALLLDIPDGAFRQAERVLAEIAIPEDVPLVAAEVASE